MRPNIALALAIQALAAQAAPQGAIRPTLDSGGRLPAEQAAYDVN